MPAVIPREALGRWIEEHQVTWELLPHYEMHGTSKVQVGYELQLFARHPALSPDDPGCAECGQIYEHLCDIARRVLPTTPHNSRVEFGPFEAAFHMRPESQFAPEVELSVEVVHEHGTFAPADSDEKSYVHEMEQALRGLGAQSKVWRGSR